ncbi:MAG: class I SAM-dependent methyltransferase [Ignavibacteria bacterium]|jgi:SAM-dependent methyltransferase|nr:class I SAM-dependent methyltransferase [Ignavibacteria bacterium]
MKQWYEQLFENYGRKYENEVFVQGTQGECDFIGKEINGDKGVKILDIGCGTGRHSIELAKRGYNVTGIDLSDSMLNNAREKAAVQNLKIDFRKADARTLTFSEEFDLVIMICEGGFSLMETDEMNFEILRSAYNSLKQGGKFIFTALNGLFPLFHSVKDFLDSSAKEGNSSLDNITFDLMTFRENGTLSFTDDDGIEKQIDTNERYYVPSEITWLLNSLGFVQVEIFGAKLGAFSRNDKLSTEDFEMLVIAVKNDSSEQTNRK